MITKGEECVATKGMYARSKMELSSHRCFMHEILHTLGLDHEFNRVDRDKFVKIHFENIEESK